MGTTGWVSQRRPGATTFLSLHTSTPKLRLWAGGLSIPFFRQKESYKNWDTMLLRNAPDSSVCVEVEVEVNTPCQRKDIGQVLRTRCCCSLAEFWPCGWFIAYFRVQKKHTEIHTHTPVHFSSTRSLSISYLLSFTLEQGSSCELKFRTRSVRNYDCVAHQYVIESSFQSFRDEKVYITAFFLNFAMINSFKFEVNEYGIK